MARKLTDAEKLEIESNPEAHTKSQLSAYLDEQERDSTGSKEELVARVKGETVTPSGGYKPDTFAARFDPENPPRRSPGPVAPRRLSLAGPQVHNLSSPDTGTTGADGPGGTHGGASSAGGGAGSTGGGTGNVGDAGTPGGATTTTPGGAA